MAPAVGRPSWLRGLLLNLITLGVTLVVTLAIVEVCLRVFSLAPSKGVGTVNEAQFARVPGLFAPGQRVVDRRIAALTHTVQIDSLGYRGPDFPIGKSTSELRVLGVGDSFTFGDFVNDDQTVPAALERQLALACQRPVTVINAGVGGSTITTHRPMVDRAWITSPDVVVLTFSENDVADLERNMWEEFAKNRRAKSRLPLSLAYPVLREMALWHFALDVRVRMRVRGEVALDRRDESVIQEFRAEYGRQFEALVKDVRARQRALILVAFPSHLTVRGTIDDEQLRWLDGLAKQHGVPSVNLLPAFRSSGVPVDSLYLLPHDGHASPRGNELAGQVVAQRMVEQGACQADRNRQLVSN